MTIRIESNTFAAACYDMNTIEELEACLANPEAGHPDCENWGITLDEWRAQIQIAIDAKRAA